MGRQNKDGSFSSRADKAVKAGVYGEVTQSGNDTRVNWADVSSEVLADFIDAVTFAGDAVSFARGRQGDYISVTILAGSERYKHPAASAKAMEALLTEITQKLNKDATTP